MRRFLNFTCEGQQCAATLDMARSTLGLLIVSGGNETRFGAGRAMARLATELCREGISVFRFDRRGVGESEGENTGFEGSGPDIKAALAAFREACPHVRTLLAYGNCDGATALLINGPFDVDGLVLSNVWARSSRPTPSRQAIWETVQSHMFTYDFWTNMASNITNWRLIWQEFLHLADRPAMDGLAGQVAQALQSNLIPTRIMIATGDQTGIGFLDLWGQATSKGVRPAPNNIIKRLDSATHGFLGGEDFQALKALILKAASSRS